MSLLTASGLAKSYGPVDLFSGISLSIPAGARIGLVGPNGVGKTTLLRLLSGLESASEGEVHLSRATRIGFLPQEADLDSGLTLWEECLNVFEDLRAQEAALADLELAMGDPQTREEALIRYGPAQEAFEKSGGYHYQTRIRQTLSGLGFSPRDHHRPVRQLSGGQRTRALLARLLLKDPDLLILDEPTNHLDISAVEWLERYLHSSRGAVVIVSHDRYFLDRVVDTIWEISRMGFERYRGSYSEYLIQRAERWALQARLFEAEISRMENDLDYIRRNIAGQNTQQAKGRLRRLSRQIEAMEQGGLLAVQGRRWGEISEEVQVSSRPMGVEEAGGRIRGLRSPLQTMPDLHLVLRTRARSGDLVLRTHSLAVGYTEEPEALFQAPDLLLRRGECAAVIGPNGAGKTTFLKTILGQVEPLAGEVVLGASLEVGYFAQGHEGLNPASTLMEEILAVAPALTNGEARSVLARFLFRGEDVFKTVGVLSGGERGRLALARLSLSQANLLLLDEPTNHLDIPSQEILQGVLVAFPGTILLVSHDRYLIDAMATQIWEIGPRGESLTAFEGTYSGYRALKEARRDSSEPAARKPREQPAVPSPPSRTMSKHSMLRRRARLAEVEAEIRSLEERLAKIGRLLERPPVDQERVRQLGEEYVEVQETIEALIADWEILSAEYAEGGL